MNKKLVIIPIVIFAAIAVVCGGAIAWITADYGKADRLYSDKASGLFGEDLIAKAMAEGYLTQDSQVYQGGNKSTFESPGVFRADFEELKKTMPDTVAYIDVGGGDISYPVVRGSDNDFYLNHLADKSPGRAGAIFMDAANASDFSGDISIIYGHMMHDDKMFSNLRKYRDSEYLKEHPGITVYTPDGIIDYEIRSVYLAEGLKETYPTAFGSEAAKESFLKASDRRAISKGPRDSEEDLTDKRVLLLSTCAYDFEEARLAVVAVER